MNMVVRHAVAATSKADEQGHTAKVAEKDLPKILKDISYALREESDVLNHLGREVADKVDVWGLARLVAKYRSEQRQKMERWQSFTTKEVEDLQRQFDKYDTQGTGELAGKQLRVLLGVLVPAARKNQAAHKRVRELLEEVDKDFSGSMDFDEFLAMMRHVRDFASSEKLKKEKLAVQETRFTQVELKGFRQVFRMFDTDNSVDMGLPELQQMLTIIVGGAATGHKSTQELKQCFKSFDEDREPGQEYAVDFPEFLQLMRHLTDQNWCGINDKSDQMVG